VPSCLPSPCVSSRHLPARGRVHPGSCDPTARRHSVKVGRCLPAGPSLPPGAGASPPGRMFGSRAWWSSPRQPGGPHCRPVLKSLGVDDARTMGMRLKQTNKLSRGCAWRWVESRRVRRNHIQYDTPDAQRRACTHSAPLLPSSPCPSPSPPAWLRSASYRSLVGARGTHVPAHRKVGAEALPRRVCPHPSSNRYQSPVCPAGHTGEESHAVTGRLATQMAASLDCAPRDHSDEARLWGGRSRTNLQLGLQARYRQGR
jgi:hypothetical protein